MFKCNSFWWLHGNRCEHRWTESDVGMFGMSCFPDWRSSMIVNRHLIIWSPCGGQFSPSVQQQCLPEEPRGFSVWVQWKIWPDFMPNLSRSLSPGGYRDLGLLSQSSAWGLPLTAYRGLLSCCLQTQLQCYFCVKGAEQVQSRIPLCTLWIQVIIQTSKVHRRRQ